MLSTKMAKRTADVETLRIILRAPQRGWEMEGCYAALPTDRAVLNFGRLPLVQFSAMSWRILFSLL